MKKALFILLAFSLLTNIYFVSKGIDLSTGGGQYKYSPDKKYMINATSLMNKNPLANEKFIYGKIELTRKKDNVDIKTITIKPEMLKDEMGYRLIKDMISWSDDSKRVKINTPNAIIEMQIHE